MSMALALLAESEIKTSAGSGITRSAVFARRADIALRANTLLDLES
jgi:hypothetical protein